MKIKIYNDFYLPEFIRFMCDNGQAVRVAPNGEGVAVEVEDSMDLSERLEELMGFEVELEDLERLRLKPARSLSNTYYCPTCGWKVGKKNISTNLEEINRFCPYCGQKISRRE